MSDESYGDNIRLLFGVVEVVKALKGAASQLIEVVPDLDPPVKEKVMRVAATLIHLQGLICGETEEAEFAHNKIVELIWIDEWNKRSARAREHAEKHWPEGASTLERIAMMHSELSEALEGVRHGNPASEHIPEFNALEEEFADVVIRMMHMGDDCKLRLAEAIDAKLAFNETRPLAHGGKVL